MFLSKVVILYNSAVTKNRKNNQFMTVILKCGVFSLNFHFVYSLYYFMINYSVDTI